MVIFGSRSSHKSKSYGKSNASHNASYRKHTSESTPGPKVTRKLTPEQKREIEQLKKQLKNASDERNTDPRDGTTEKDIIQYYINKIKNENDEEKKTRREAPKLLAKQVAINREKEEAAHKRNEAAAEEAAKRTVVGRFKAAVGTVKTAFGLYGGKTNKRRSSKHMRKNKTKSARR